jgi:hypothetical protein
VTSFAKPPAGPSACAKVQVGFAPSLEVPSDAGASSGLASPGRRATKSSLLSRALLDTPTISSELYGAAAPSQAFSVSACCDAAVGGADQRLLVLDLL